jgi:D-alanyl-D-alanine carboxypeptidase
MRKLAGFLTVLLLVCACSTEPSARIQRVADNAIEDDTTGGVVFAIVDANGDVLGASAGDQVDGTPIPLDGRFRIGSVTKTFVATAVLQLVDAGAIELGNSLPEEILAPHAGHVTIQSLLRHQTGMPDYVQADGFWERVRGQPDVPLAIEEVLAFIADPPRSFPTGVEWEYSNTNYIYLGLLIEAVTGESVEEVLRRSIFEPLGLDDTYLAGAEEGAPVVQAPIWIPDQGVLYPYPYDSHESSHWTAGAIVSSASDLGVFFAALFDGRLLSAELLDRMTSVTPGSDTGDPVAGYGMGLNIYQPQELDGVTFYGHGGGVPGFQTLVWHYPENSETIVMLSTDGRTDFKDAALTMADIVLAENE